MDAVEWLRSLPSESVDLAITDVPYESLEKHRARGTTTRLRASWFEIFHNARFEELFREVHRVLRNNTHFYFQCDAETMFVAKPIAESVGFKFWKPLVWDKVSIGMGYHYRSRCEFILFFEKGKRNLNDWGVADIITAKRVFNAGYPTAKPPEVAEVLISQSTEPGEFVIDPFMGSGSVGVACARVDRLFAGNDLSTSAVELARTRIAAAEHRVAFA